MPIFEPDSVLNQEYQVERFLGEGAFAEVYRVQHRFLGRQAMKVFKAPTESDEEVHRVLAEAILLSRLGHPNIIRVFNAGTLSHEGAQRGYFTMEFVPGGTLDRHWRSYGKSFMPIREAVEICRQVATGVAVAHAEDPPIVHRDIKPQNILAGYDANGIRIRVGDFGLAKHVNPMTLLLSSKGTIGFKPPEAFENLDSMAGDVWAIGCVMYLLLTDEHPFPEATKRGELVKRSHLPTYRPPSVFNIRVDPMLDGVIERCLRFDPGDRFANAGDLLKALQGWEDRPEQPHTEDSTAEEKGGRTPEVAEAFQGDNGDWEEPLSRAMELAKSPASLSRAADILEELMSRHPLLRERHDTTIKLWRRGISM